MIGMTRLRYCPDTQAYINRRMADGLTKPDAIRCVKRYVARQTCDAVRADLGAAMVETPRHAVSLLGWTEGTGEAFALPQ
jgi:hypothetical protein